MGMQVITLMWLRTTVNYQYRYGVTRGVAFRNMWNEGGVRRLYRGLPFALLQGPLVRFGDTAANAGLEHFCRERNAHVAVQTAGASLLAASWRVVLMPIDTAKTFLQVEGTLGQLKTRTSTSGLLSLYRGAGATFAVKLSSHYPWFLTHNVLTSISKQQHTHSLPPSRSRRVVENGVIGLACAVVSDCCTNWMRVLKTIKQTKPGMQTYRELTKQIIAESSVWGLATRGLTTRLSVNCLQSVWFNITWKLMEEEYDRRYSAGPRS